MKKVILILLMFLLASCSADSSDTNSESETLEFIKPVEDKEVFSYLNDDASSILKSANSGKSMSNKALENLGKSLPDLTLKTIDNKEVKLSDYQNQKLVIEVVSIYCSHCKDQTYKYTDEMLDILDGITFIQFFIDGEEDSIKSFYKEINKDIDDRALICAKDDDFNTYIKNTLDVDATPTFLFFNNNAISFFKVGLLDIESFNNLYDVAFENAFDINNLTDSEGNSIFNYIRTSEDVLNDLSEDSYNKIKTLDNDDSTLNLTLNNIGKTFDFTNQLDDESTFISEVNFIDYVNSSLMIVRVSEYDETFFDLLNDFYKENKDVEMIVINMSDEDNQKMADKLDMPFCSVLNQIPEKLNEENLGTNPACIFVMQGIITGIYSNIDSLDNLTLAKNTFLTEESIALVKNNQ